MTFYHLVDQPTLLKYLFYHRKGINLVVADYRGYGASNGVPTFSNLISDAHCIYQAVKQYFKSIQQFIYNAVR